MSLSLVMSLASDVARLIVGNRQGLGARGYVAFTSVTEYFHGGGAVIHNKNVQDGQFVIYFAAVKPTPRGASWA